MLDEGDAEVIDLSAQMQTLDSESEGIKAGIDKLEVPLKLQDMEVAVGPCTACIRTFSFHSIPS